LHWRISNKLGYGHTFRKNRTVREFIFDDAISPKKGDILVIDDGGLDFRKQEKVYKELLKCNWKFILLKMSNPVASGPLFQELIKNHSEKLVVITTANELRQSNVKISKGVSWEQSISDLVLELNHNKQIEDLKGMLSEATNFDLDKFLSLNVKDSNEYILSFKGFSIENIELLADCISQTGFSEKSASSKEYLEKALKSKSYTDPGAFAVAYLALGNKERAIKYVEKAIKEKLKPVVELVNNVMVNPDIEVECRVFKYCCCRAAYKNVSCYVWGNYT